MAYSIDLSGRVAFITGASGGLGAQFAKTLSRAGAAVILASRRIEKLKDLRAHIEGEGGDAHVYEMDVTDIASIKSAVAHAETEVGSIDILVNNSGVSTTQRLQDVMEEEYDFVIKLDPKDDISRSYLADIFLAAKKYDAAESVYKDLTVRLPKQLQSWQGLTATLIKEGRFLEAMYVVRKALDLDQDNPSTHVLMAKAALNMRFNFQILRIMLVNLITRDGNLWGW